MLDFTLFQTIILIKSDALMADIPGQHSLSLSALTLSKLISGNSGVLKNIFWEQYHVPQKTAKRTEIIYLKYLTQCLTQRKYSINSNY